MKKKKKALADFNQLETQYGKKQTSRETQNLRKIKDDIEVWIFEDLSLEINKSSEKKKHFPLRFFFPTAFPEIQLFSAGSLEKMKGNADFVSKKWIGKYLRMNKIFFANICFF